MASAHVTAAGRTKAVAILQTAARARSNWDAYLMTDRVERVGNTVRRPMRHWSPAVHDLLHYLEGIDFPAPRVLRAEDGVETLTWIDGETGAEGWAKVVQEAGLRRWARFLRFYDDAARGAALR